MSAGPNAKPLGFKNWQLDGKELSEEEAKETARLWVFDCECGYVGSVNELLAEDDNDTLYCPKCRTAAWFWR